MTVLKSRSDVTAKLVPGSLAGSDEMICKAARVSTLGSASLETGEARGLINYLMSNRHGSPFEHGNMTFLVEAPLFVAREFMRHRIGWSYNETSGRYKELEPLFYVPGPDRDLVQQGKPGEYTFVPGTPEQWELLNEVTDEVLHVTWGAYERMLREGIAKEVARNVLPLNLFTSFYATCNPRSLMHYLSLRTKEDNATFPSYPLREIEMVAEQMEFAFGTYFPLTYKAWNKAGRVAP
jgi:thymidylate synthase (FAD)